MDLEKVEAYVDNDNLVIKIYGQGSLPSEFESVIKNNMDLKVIISVKIFRRDFKPLNITTEMTNYTIMRQISYDLITGNFLVFDGIKFKLTPSLEDVSKNIFPIVFKQKIGELKALPDFSPVYEDTDFVVGVKMRASYLDLKPPLSIIASILNLGGIEGKDVYSDPFLIR
jgi:hypothetical protein